MTEIFGYVASALILISFMINDMRTLRWVNTVGCAIFIVYGVLLPSIPIIITNGAIVLVNFYYLFLKDRKKSA